MLKNHDPKGLKLVQTQKALSSIDIRLIDFGCTILNDSVHHSLITTPYFRAPEVTLGLEWSYPSDIWSVGCVIFEFATGKHLFPSSNSYKQLKMMQNVLGPIPQSLICRASRLSIDHLSV
ncbi:kinase-like domain-containing protein [Spinellus fusiger]|nr:kinase-like domain-containing protein [Spinellus fusiger]